MTLRAAGRDWLRCARRVRRRPRCHSADPLHPALFGARPSAKKRLDAVLNDMRSGGARRRRCRSSTSLLSDQGHRRRGRGRSRRPGDAGVDAGLPRSRHLVARPDRRRGGAAMARRPRRQRLREADPGVAPGTRSGEPRRSPLARWTRIYNLAEEEVPDWEEPPVFPTPDRFFMVKFTAEDPEDVKLVERLIDGFLSRRSGAGPPHHPRRADRTAARGTEEMAYRWHNGRMQISATPTTTRRSRSPAGSMSPAWSSARRPRIGRASTRPCRCASPTR